MIIAIQLANFIRRMLAYRSAPAHNAKRVRLSGRARAAAWFDYELDGTGHTLTLYSRAAFAHDFENEGVAVAAFQQLPGSSFLINAAKPAANGALVTGGVEYSLADGWSVLGKFDGEFSNTPSIYAGTGTLRKSW